MTVDRSAIGRRSKKRGYEYEHYLEQHLPGYGFTDTKKQPLSGALLDRPEMTGDLAPTFRTEDGHVYKFLVSAKRTAKTAFSFESAWITEIMLLAEPVGRIGIVMFAMYGRPRMIHYVVIPESSYIGMIGNTDNIMIHDMDFRGKKFLTMKKAVLEEKIVNVFDNRLVARRFEGPEGQKNLLFNLEVFVKAI